MRSRFGRPPAEILDVVKALLADRRVVVADDAVSSGIAFAEAGGDFADGVIAYDGRRLGGTMFASFDRKANRIAATAGFDILPVPDRPLAG